MQKQYRLRWKPSDSKALTRAINKFNRRVRSLEKAHPENIGYYPERVKYGWYRDAIKTRYDLKREIATLNKFSAPGMEELSDVGLNAKITKWQMEESTKRVENINKEREQRLKYISRLEKRAGGMKLGYTNAKFGFSSDKLKQYEPMSVISEHAQQQDIGKKWKAIVKYSSTRYYADSDYLWRDNYIKSLEENYGSEADELIAKIKSMPIGKYLKIAYSDSEAEIKYNYANNYIDSVARLKELYDIWGLNTNNFEQEFVVAEELEDSDFM